MENISTRSGTVPGAGRDRPDAQLRELTGYCLRRTTATVMTEFNHVFSAFGLRRTTFSALALVVDNPGMRQSQLAEALAIERPNLVQIIDELEKSGCLERKTAENDRRAYALVPTAKGRELLRSAMAAVKKQDAKLTEGLSQLEVETLRRLLWRLQENASSVEAPAKLKISSL